MCKVLWRQWDRLTLIQGILHRRWEELDGKYHRWQMVVPRSKRQDLIHQHHGGKASAHLGVDRTFALLSHGFYWPEMKADIDTFCRKCDCALLNKSRGYKEPLCQYVVGEPMERLAVDVAGPYPVSKRGNRYCLMVRCYFTKWLECFPIPVQKAETVASKLAEDVIARFGSFRELHSDQGSNFESEVFQKVCDLFGIYKTRNTAYHPQSDGFIERSFRTLGRCLKAYCHDTGEDWDMAVPFLMTSYRASPQSSTKLTPNLLMLGRETMMPVQALFGRPICSPEAEKQTLPEYVEKLRDILQDAHHHARMSLNQAAQYQKHKYDSRVRGQEFEVGDLVWIHDSTTKKGQGKKLKFPSVRPALIVKMLDAGRAVILRKKLKPATVIHVNRIERYHGNEIPRWMLKVRREVQNAVKKA